MWLLKKGSFKRWDCFEFLYKFFFVFFFFIFKSLSHLEFIQMDSICLILST